ncbi:MAG: hypothetical protein A3A94_03520 [Candidatus Portnoybacteria bacterium RIFCSPLOWO2_01_FULL_43_11]|uniref:Methyltransferase type 11 domain-containing protein n=4 Tax=Bacteria candidate phyla TaxID=1783234 RepID=A0A1G2FRW4_9BACT|nr:MAG: hypothetical protein A2713_01855 [candidate division WWE3 bacterium RIFCSPHIGHO2_01_FULL_35_17]OGZ37900.1 MAG: hypothetical protein A3E90_01495 [Candidatus Portnoybacteria bacterium RIFCSPHIGHO2_12_FULL_40_11]OGZ38419.1 MAG: hypothetical protein A3A94_03520 [Candidatus Portnoybacteria bacterium RIFCSPLOWO2_01_FULL_43_11]OGZ40826.1 MAG: hypothetical protein A3I20_02375 [Candidatus Portnoybacteria bacterium RIFCSPLOWO2_02_FULL_40_15]
MKKLNLGCGYDIRPGFINADFMKTHPDVLKVDFSKFPYPFSDNEFDEIHAYGVLEHLGETREEFKNVIKELIRITKNSGQWFITVPHDTNPSFYGEFHRTMFHWRSFHYNLSTPEKEIYKDLEVVKRRHIFIKLLFWNFLIISAANLWPKFYENTCLRYLFPCQTLYFEIKVKKND